LSKRHIFIRDALSERLREVEIALLGCQVEAIDEVEGATTAPQAAVGFVSHLNRRECTRDERFLALSERYEAFADFCLETEAEVREYVLVRLMVNDRPALESTSGTRVPSRDTLLMLNLAAQYATGSPDLRFLDALNYYFEMLADLISADGERDELITSFLVRYKKALTSTLERFSECE